MKQSIDVAAYIWPAYTGKEPRTHIFWPERHGEWQTVRAAKPKFEGHAQPRVPLWGYEEEADPRVMEKQIDEALSHGVNVFAYDWYWYDGRPFLEQCLDEGFLGASNHRDMKFYLMWANHHANYLWDKRLASDDASTILWQATVTEEQFRAIGRRWIEKYFCEPNYYRIDGKPLVSIYDITNFCDSFGGLDGARRMMEALDEEARRAGLGGVHFQLIHRAACATNLSGVDGSGGDDIPLLALPFSSVTHYQYVHMTNIRRDYADIQADVEQEWARLAALSDIPYYPHVSLGWDNNPRHTIIKPNIMQNNTPAAIEKALQSAKDFALSHGVPMITVNSWNEWTEGSYLLPDTLNGYGYLEAVKQVFLNK